MPDSTRYAIRLAAGLCGACGQAPPAEGRTNCPDCLAARAASESVRRERLAKSHTCLDCAAEPALPGQRRCARCAEVQRVRMRRSDDGR